MSNETDFDEGNAIAIVGMVGRFPQAADVETFWHKIRDGVECLTTFTDEELLEAGEEQSRIEQPNYIKVGGPLEDMEGFDAGFFGFSPRDASILDPQHRHILECAWEALEDAAIDPDTFEGSIGVFAGSGHNAYMPYNLLTNPALLDSVGFFLLRHTGNDKDFLATRISYCLKLTGPSINVQTACSTSLVATHLACQSLLNSECDLALAGGVTIEMPHRRGYIYQEGEILAPDGHCRAFDAASAGTLFGSGVGVVALRRYADAVEDGDIIHAVIRGSAINNDGANKVGYLAPSVEGQSACIREALALSEVDPATITYVECHGTGTPVGDPIEVVALTEAFREETDDTEYCGIGSVKPNIGHVDTAAGVASLIKTVQALKHRQLPPTLHFKSPNPTIDFASSPFYVNAELKAWDTDGTPRRAAVNSLGVGGTNAFVVLQETPERAPSGPGRPWKLLPLSARSADAVDSAGQRLAAHLRAHAEIPLEDAAYTLAVGRRDFEHRRMVVARDAADAAQALEDRDPARVFTQRAEPRSVAFLFPGGGAQYPNMARELYETEPVYKQEVDRCLELLGKHVDWKLADLLFPAPGEEEAAAEALQHGSRTLPSLFITEYALAKLFIAWGIAPTALLGHSMGEYVAACLAEVFTVEDGLRMVLLRGQLFESVEKGAMLSVPLPRAELVAMMGDELDVAVVNGPSITVASGPVAAIDELHAALEAREVDSRRIKIHVAAHSRMLEPILPTFAGLTETIEFGPPKIPFLSNVSGTWITDAEATDPNYWVRHLRGTVQFSDNLEELLSDPTRVVLEVAPGRTLSSLARAHPSAGLGRPVFNSLRHPREEISDVAFLLNVIGRLWLCGVDIDWNAFYAAEDRQRVSLPTYPFEHQRYWIEPGETQAAPTTRSLKKKADLSEWFYQPSWRRQLLPSAPSVAAAVESEELSLPWLVFVDDCGFGAKLVSQLRAAGQPVATVAPGDRFESLGADAYSVQPDSAEDYDRLWTALGKSGQSPRRVLHMWTLAGDDAPSGIDGYEFEQNRGFYSMLFLAQALGKDGASEAVNVAVVSNRMQQVAAEPVHRPERATVLGPCKVMMQELPNVTCRSIDIDLPKPGSWQEQLLLDRVPQEVMSLSSDHVIAYRGHDRFVQEFQPSPLPEPVAGQSRLRQAGVYLITGGLGGLGLLLAEHLATAHQARLVLVSRTALPDPESWEDYLAEHGADDRISRRIRKLQALETAGAELMIAVADVTKLSEMQRVVHDAVDRFGELNGVFHTAGVLDDGIIQMKTREQAAAVLAPKVLGTLVLDAALEGIDLEFLLLYSSVSAFTGLTGQVDYAAANAFLDAFAHARTERDGLFTVALNWNAWQQVGMAAELARELGLATGGAAERQAAHPLLDRSVRETSTQREYASTISTDTHWLVDEHRIKDGEALIPGTGYLELARAALAENPRAGKAIEIRDLTFMAPFVVRANESRELRVSLERDGDAWRLQITGGAGAETHALGEVAFVDASSPQETSISEIAARCQGREQTFDSAADAHLDFGERWNNRKSVNYGDREALISLELPQEFADDCQTYSLHPALMDFATAGAQALIPEFSPDTHFYVPLSYGKIVVRAPLPPKIYSHVRLEESSDEIAVYSVDIYDQAGSKLVEISEFVMRRVEDRAVMSELAAVGSVEARPDPTQAKPDRGTATGNPILELGLQHGIAPDEGMQAIERVLAGPLTAQLIVSSQDLDALIASTRPAEPWEADQEAAAEALVAVERPNLATPYAAPETELAKTIVAVWEEILGVSGIGVHDDFFDLGGHSLLLTQVLSRVRKQVDAELSLRALFEKRTVVGIAEEIEKAKQKAASGRQGPTLERLAREDYRIENPDADAAPAFAFPASFAQQRLWFLDQIESGTAVYSIPQALRLRGPLKLEVLSRSLAEVVERHESLRTYFGSNEGTPQQIVGRPAGLELEIEDLRALPQAERLAVAEARVAEQASQGFDLATGPLLRTTAYVLAEDDVLLLLNVHHIACDGWSLALLFTELSALYRAYAADQPSPLGPLAMQYPDYSVWQHVFFQGEELETELAFWTEYLGGDLPQLSLPFDRNRPAQASMKGKLVRFNLSESEAEAVKALAREEKASLYMTLLAAFQAFLHRMTSDTDILIGSPIANRDREEIREGIGFYTNTVVFRGDLGGAPSFRELLRRQRDNVLSVLAHQELPLERVVEAINPDRAGGDNPVFQVMFALQQAPESAFAIDDVDISMAEVHSATSKFDLLLEMQELSAGMQCFLEYATDLFDDSTAERFVQHFQYLLAELVADPDKSIADASLLAPDQRTEILETWNQSQTDYRSDMCLHQMVAEQAAARPDAIAIQTRDATLSYGELDARANQLAQHLQTLGVGPDSMIGVFTERGTEMMVGLLGALKSGAAYLPLDPSFPPDRIAYMLQDSGAPVVLTQEHLLAELPETTAQILRLDTDWNTIAEAPTEAPATEATSTESLAYMIYTSGSTGKPKGVQIPHRAAVNFLESMAKVPGITRDDKLLAVTTLSFDISVLEIFLPLVSGATVVIASRDEAVDGADLIDRIQAAGVTIMQATPATWQLMLEAGWQRNDTLQKLLCGGEAWPAGLARQLIDRADQVWNMYGPTETTIWSTCARVTEPENVVIGKQIANTTTYVLDARLKPVPVGVAGELHIGGDGLARGYHQRPELTAERFIENPFGPGKLYKTGDSVKHLPDGSLQYLNRLDNQVKVRGYRIELGEIETVLESHPKVKQPVVIVWDGGSGDKRIAAYIVYEPGDALTGSELRKFLRKDLPEYMIPHLFVEMDELPLTANNKVDRRRLPDPLKQGQADNQEFVEPGTDNEKLVAELWKTVIKIDKVGLHDNFFDLGGHSLLSTQVTFKLHKATGYRVSPRAMVFQNLAQIAAELPAKQEPAAAAAQPAKSTSEPKATPAPKRQPTPAKPLARKLFDRIKKRLR